MMHEYESAVQKARLLEQAPGALDSLRDEKDVKLIKGVLAVFPDVIERDQSRSRPGGRRVRAATGGSAREELLP